VEVQDVMIVVRSGVIAMSALILVALASCATTRSQMLTSSDRLERSAAAFAIETRDYFPDASEFADQVRAFRETVDRAGDREVLSEFEQLWNNYYALRDEVEHSDSQQAKVGFKPVTQAFREVVSDIKGYADSDPALYARGGFQHDQYYDP